MSARNKPAKNLSRNHLNALITVFLSVIEWLYTILFHSIPFGSNEQKKQQKTKNENKPCRDHGKLDTKFLVVCLLPRLNPAPSTY